MTRGVEVTAVPYNCPAGFWPIEYCHRCDPKHPPITEAEADVYLALDLRLALAATLWRRVIQRDWIAAGQELRRWVSSGARVLPELMAQQEAEIALVST